MQKPNRRILTIFAVIFITTLLCVGLIAGAWYTFFQILEVATTENPPFTVKTRAPQSTSSITNTPANTPAAGTSVPELPQDILDQMLLIEGQVIEYRQLIPNSDIIRILYTPEDLRERVTNDFFSDYTPEDAALDVIILSLFGLLEPDADILDIYIELYSESISGFYDDETGEMVIVQGSEFGGYEHFTYVHEYTHALQDQNYATDDGLGCTAESYEQDSERCAALQALIEGDAAFSEIFWYYQYATQQQRADIASFYEDFDNPTFDASPPFIQQDLGFPYISGQDFVLYLYEEGGWPAVDAAHINPPVSTEQILHPDRYPNDTPIAITLPDLTAVLGSDWEIIDEDVLGEWFTILLLAYGIDPSFQINESQAKTAAEGWGGDAYAVYQDTQTQQTALALLQEWDTALDATEYVDAFTDYATSRFGNPVLNRIGQIDWITSDGYHIFQFQGNQTIWVFAPDKATAETLLNSLLTQ